MSGRWRKYEVSVVEADKCSSGQTVDIVDGSDSTTWASLAKLIMGVHVIGLVGIYCYSVYLGFEVGFFKGCFMLLLPVVAQIWLFFEEWICNPCGFSCTYVTFSFCVLMCAVLAGILQRMSELPPGLADKSERIGLLIFGAVVIAIGCYRYKVMEQGATSPSDVAHAYVIAASRFDVQMAKYYSGRGMQDWFEDIGRAFRDRKDDLKQVRKSVQNATKGLTFRAEKLNEDLITGNVRVAVEIIGHGDVLSTEYLTLEKQYGDWKVVDGGKFEAQWKETAKQVRGLF